jgi:hypothetical protein
MFADFLQRLTIFEGNIPRDDILNGLGHLNYSTLQNAVCNLIKDFLGLLGDSLAWSRKFEDPIPLPRGREIITLKDAANYIMKLPKAEQNLEQWQTATKALIMAAEGRGPLMHARIGVLKALNWNVERAFNPDRKDSHWGKRKLKRDE